MKKQAMIRITSAFVLAALVASMFRVSVFADTTLAVSGLLNTTGMPSWGANITVQPGETFKVFLSAFNSSATDQITNATILDNIPSNTSFVAGSANVLVGSAWQVMPGSGTSPFLIPGITVSGDGVLDPGESAQYKYSVLVASFLPSGTSSLSWNGPSVNFTDINGNSVQGSTDATSITLSGVPTISSAATNAGSYTLGQIITITATGPAGLNAYAVLTTGRGNQVIPLVGVGTAYTGTYTVVAGDTIANTTPRVYFESSPARGSYADTNSIIIDATATGGGSGNGGGGGGQSSPGIVTVGGGGFSIVKQEVSKTFSYEEQLLTVFLSTGSTGAVRIFANTFTTNTTVTLSEVVTSEQAELPLPKKDGIIVGNNVFTTKISQNGKVLTEFPKEVKLYVHYTDSQAKGLNTDLFYIAQFNPVERVWVPLVSTLDKKTNTVTAFATKTGIFGLVAYNNFIDFTKKPNAPVVPNTDGTGQVLGVKTGIYPNGTLLRVEGDDAIWYIAGNEKHFIPSPAVFTSNFVWDRIITLPSTRQLDLYQRGDDVVFSVGTLVKTINDSTIYRISAAGGVQPFISAEAFKARGNKYNAVLTISSTILASYRVEEPITKSTGLLEGDLVKTRNDGPTVWQIQNGIAKWFLYRDMFTAHSLSVNKVWLVAQEAIERFIDRDKQMFYPDGSLIKGTGATVYVMSDGAKRPIASATDFDALLYSRKQIKHVSNNHLNLIPDGPILQVISE